MIENILFDLDGTLWAVDMDEFINTYMGLLAEKMADYGFDKKELIATLWKGTKAMVLNDGSLTNEEVFWNVFFKVYPDVPRDRIETFIDFYRNEFDEVARIAKPYEGIREWFDHLKEKGYRLILATNPFFPEVATRKRISWSGLDESDFEYVGSYENSSYCKPNPDYYKDLIRKLDIDPAKSLMVGNDVDEDMMARDLGMEVFLLTDHILNPHDKDIEEYPHGNFEDLKNYVEKIGGK